jgi:hypothetical protein
MPCYTALALLLASAMTEPRAETLVKYGRYTLAAIVALAAVAIGAILAQVWNLPAPGDISRALTQNPEAYTLSLGHMGDLTIASFAYLRMPLILAGVACIIGVVGAIRCQYWTVAVMMITFLHAARLALVTFDPYLASRPLAEALNRAPHGKLILDNQYYAFSSVVFYANAYRGERVFLLNGRVNNLEYGSWEQGAPIDIFLDDSQFRERWLSPDLYYVCVEKPQVARFEKLVGRETLHTLVESGGKSSL